MKKSNILLVFMALVISQTACVQAITEDQKMKDYAVKKGWTIKSTPEGVYYVIDTEGSGGNPTVSNTVTVKYKVTDIYDNLVEDNSTKGITSPLTQLYPGWQVGIPKFKKGGKGKLLIPTAYTNNNGLLIFEVELVDYK